MRRHKGRELWADLTIYLYFFLHVEDDLVLSWVGHRSYLHHSSGGYGCVEAWKLNHKSSSERKLQVDRGRK
jgi:hypothetical protein